MISGLKHIGSPQKAFGLHIALTDSGKQYFLVEVIRKGDELLVASTHRAEQLADLPSLKGQLVGIHLSGKGILTKQAPNNYQGIHSIFPNINPEEFHTQEFNNAISLIRKDHFDGLVNSVEGAFVASAQLDSVATLPIEELIEDKSESFFNVGDKRIDNNFFPAFSAAFKAITKIDDATLTITSVEQSRLEYTEKIKFNLIGATTLGVALIVLLGNILILQKYTSSNQELASKANQYQAINSKQQGLRKSIDERERLIEEFGWTDKRFISQQADLIAGCMPKSLLLNELTFTPIDEEQSRIERRTVFINYQIHISGISKTTEALNKWIEQLEALDFIHSISIQSYNYDAKKKNGAFKLIIKTT